MTDKKKRINTILEQTAAGKKSKRARETADMQSFISDYRNLVRDLFVYGTKTAAGQDASSVSAGIDTLRNALVAEEERFEWTSNKKERLYLAATPRVFSRNPFQKLYLFSSFANYGIFSDCIHTLMLMRADIVTPDFEDYYDDSEDAPAWRTKRDRYATALVEELEKGEGFETASLYTAVTPPDAAGLFQKPDMKTLRNHLETMEELGIVRGEKESGKKSKRWMPGAVFLRDLLRAAQAAGKHPEKQVAGRMHAFAEFFSRYASLGAYGQQITLRMLSAYPHESVFRFRQDYLQDTLNDYMVQTILYAIEKKLWCRIYVGHGIDHKGRRLIFCRPIEIRKGDATGRTFLMLYDPATRLMRHERLEFIDEIHFYRMGTDDEGDMRNAQEAMQYSWGVSLPRAIDRDGNAAAESETKRLRFTLSAKGKEADALYERLSRISRAGRVSRKGDTITFEADVLETIELRPLLRTLYGYLDKVEGMEDGVRKSKNRIYDTEDFLSRDFDEVDAFYAAKDAEPAGYRFAQEIRPREIDKGRSVSKQQQFLLFNEYYSIYYHLAGHAVTEHAKSGKPLARCMEEALSVYRPFAGSFTRAESGDMAAYLEGEGNYVTDAGERRYVIEDEDVTFGLDIMPLTEPEQRWLMSVLDEARCPYAALFFDAAELAAMRDVLSAQPFPTEKVLHHERFRPAGGAASGVLRLRSATPEHSPAGSLSGVEATRGPIEATRFRDILTAVAAKRALTVEAGGKTREVLPLMIEYAKRDNVFVLRGLSDGALFSLPLHEAGRIRVTATSFSKTYAQLLSLYESCMKDTLRSVTVTFAQSAGLAERVLSEFSFLCKKVTDGADGLYEMQIFYHEDEEEEMTERILSYGTMLRIKDKNHALTKRIRERLAKQRERVKERAPRKKEKQKER